MDGLEFLRELRRFDLDVPVLIVTGAPSLETRREGAGVRRLPLHHQAGPVRGAAARRWRGRSASTSWPGCGGWRCRWWSRSGHALGDRASLEARFESAMATARIAFQPIISWQRRKVMGYEALLRTAGADPAAPRSLHRRGRPPGPPARAGAAGPGQDRRGDRDRGPAGRALLRQRARLGSDRRRAGAAQLAAVPHRQPGHPGGDRARLAARRRRPAQPAGRPCARWASSWRWTTWGRATPGCPAWRWSIPRW